MSEFVCEQFVRRYLMSHNYFRTLAVFDGESSSDSLGDRFQPSKIIGEISRAITYLDCETLENIWKSLEDCFSSRLDRDNGAKFESLKAYTFKALLCEAVKSKQITCVTSFFSSQTLFDFSSPAWIHWPALPFVKEPAKHNLFSRYFTKTWLDVLFMSLSNFLCVLFLSLPNPLKNDIQQSVFLSPSANHASLPRTNAETLDDFTSLPAFRTAKQR